MPQSVSQSITWPSSASETATLSPRSPGSPEAPVSELLQQVRIIDPASQTDQIADVWLEAGQVRAIGANLVDVPDTVQRIDAQEWILAPGLVDLYSHSGEPGNESCETIASLQAAARAGGFTRVGILPDTQPVIDSPAMVAQVIDRAMPQQPQLLPWAAMTQNRAGEQLSELAELAQTACVGFADGRAIDNLLLIRRLLEYAQPLARPIALWCYSKTLANRGTAREGIDSLRLGLPGDAAMSETAILAAVLECLASVEAPIVPLHLMRISTARGVELIAQAKARGLAVTASTPWTHLLLSTRNLSRYDPRLHFAPPLGTPDDRDALIAGVRSGVIDAIAIDHTPISYEDKTVAFSEAPPGAIGLELALALLWQEFIDSGEWSPLDLWRSLSLNPARCLNLKPPMLQVGEPAELVLFAPNRPWTIVAEQLQSRSCNTPWLDRQVSGRVVRTYLPH